MFNSTLQALINNTLRIPQQIYYSPVSRSNFLRSQRSAYNSLNLNQNENRRKQITWNSPFAANNSTQYRSRGILHCIQLSSKPSHTVTISPER